MWNDHSEITTNKWFYHRTVMADGLESEFAGNHETGMVRGRVKAGFDDFETLACDHCVQFAIAQEWTNGAKPSLRITTMTRAGTDRLHQGSRFWK